MHARSSPECRLKIVQVAVSFRAAGTERLILEISERAIRRGAEVHVVVPPNASLDCYAQELLQVGVTVHRIGPLHEVNRKAIRNFSELFRLFRRLRPDVVHYHIPWAPLCHEAILAGFLARVPKLIRTEHNPIVGPLSPRQRYKLLLLDRMVDRFVMVSSGMMASHLASGRKMRDAIVIPNGIEMSWVDNTGNGDTRFALRHELGIPSQACAFVVVAALEERKRVPDFLLAAARAAQGHDDLFFAVIGDGPSRGALGQQITDLGMSRLAHLYGYRSDVKRLYAAFDVYVQASEYEGLSVAMLEALATGLPMITTEVDGVIDVLPDGDGALVVPVGDVARLSEAMLELARSPARRAQLSAVSTERVRSHFGIDRVFEEYWGLYTLRSIDHPLSR